MRLRNIIWTAVVAAGAGIGTVIAALLGSTDLVLALGFVGLIAALLSGRER